jgi:YbbR domain-containing protein
MNIRKLLVENWGIKLVSLGLSLSLWLYVTSKGKTEMTLSVPLELRNIPQNMAIVGNVTGSLDVRVQGRERALRDIMTGEKVAGVLDLSFVTIGENIVRISPDDIRRPPGVTIMHLSPAEINVKLEPLVRKTFSLQPILHGAPADGYRLAKITVSPQRITVEGPESLMTAMDRLQTAPIDIQDASASMTVEPRIDYQGQLVKILDKNISVNISIRRTGR